MEGQHWGTCSQRDGQEWCGAQTWDVTPVEAAGNVMRGWAWYRGLLVKLTLGTSGRAPPPERIDSSTCTPRPPPAPQAENAYRTLRVERMNKRLAGVRAKRAAEEAAAAKDAA